MITRVFRVRIDPAQRAEFEQKFQTVSIDTVETAAGFLSAEIGKPTAWAPDEYMMISRWESEDALRKFAGDSWNQAHIPAGMEKFVRECWVHHYASFE